MSFEGKRVLVTGGAGFIGSHLVERLVEEGADAVVLDNFSTGHRENLREVEDRIRIIDGDIRDVDVVARAMEGVELVYHEAALASVPESMGQPQLYFDVNVTGTLNVLVAAHNVGVRRVVFASSSAVYGDSPESPKREDMISNPLSPYALSKLVGEQICALFNKTYGVQTVCLRYFNVYGPRQEPGSAYAAVTPKFILALLNQRQPQIFGDGEQSRSLIYVSDVVESNIRAATIEAAAGRVINVAGDVALTVNEILRHISNKMGLWVEPVYQSVRNGDIRHSSADVRIAKDVLGMDQLSEVETGMASTVNFYKTHDVR